MSAYRLGEGVMKVGGSSEARLVALVMILAGTIGAFMSSSAIVAMLIPVVLAIANEDGTEPKTNAHAAFDCSADQRHDDLDCILTEHDRRSHASVARFRPP